MSSAGVSRKRRRRWIAGGLAVGLALAAFGFVSAFANSGSSLASSETTQTPIKHLVVIFQENESFDHYFGTYPNAANLSGEPAFTAAPGTPSVNGLSPALLNANPNKYNPRRLSHFEALTCDMDHGYTDEQKAYDHGLVDRFPEYTSSNACEKGLVMDYYDGNTVTGLWNLAQHFALNDNSFDTQYGPSTPGAINLISGETGGAEPATLGGVTENGTDLGDENPFYDGCGEGKLKMTGKNIGDLLNAKHVTWGWFQGGFAPTSTNSAGYAVCGAEHENVGGAEVADYSPHHNPFEYYKSTANPKHLPPSSEAMIGQTDQANHEYDLSDFYTTLKDGNMPAVSYLKAAEYQDAHPGYSDPLDEQNFIVNTVNKIEESKFWKSTAIVITYDDSDGWYDHQNSPRPNGSHDSTTDQAVCTNTPTRLGSFQDRCGYGPRLPLVVISPYTRSNYVSHNLTDQSSVVSFIENNWLHGQRIGKGSFDVLAGNLAGRGGVLDFNTRPNFRPLILNPTTGAVVSKNERRRPEVRGRGGRGSGPRPPR